MQEIVDAFQAAVPGVKVELQELTGPDYTDQAANRSRRRRSRPTSSALAKATSSPSGSRVAIAPFIDLTGKIDVSGLSDTALGQVQVDDTVYGTPLAAYTVGLAIQNPVFAKHEHHRAHDLGRVQGPLPRRSRTRARRRSCSGGKDRVHTFFMYIGLASSVLGLDGVRAASHRRAQTDRSGCARRGAAAAGSASRYFKAGFEATDYATAKAIFANEQGAMMVAGTADYTGYRQVNPKADLSFVAWPGPEAGKKATTTGFELLYTVSKFASPEKQDAATKFVNWLATKDAQQLVSDKIALPVNVNVTGSTDKIRQETVTAGGRRRCAGLVRHAGAQRDDATRSKEYYGGSGPATTHREKFASQFAIDDQGQSQSTLPAAATPQPGDARVLTEEVSCRLAISRSSSNHTQAS